MPAPHPDPQRPFINQLARFAAYIFVGWNVLGISMFVSAFIGLIGLVAIGAAFSTGDSSLSSAPAKLGTLENIWGDPGSSHHLLVIPINGVIIGDSDGGGLGQSLSGATNGYDIKAKLREAADRTDVDGVMLEINSPGGTIYGARAIADGVKYYRERSGQPIYAHIQGTGASGAYWAASSTDRVLADYGSDIGSIGVIMGPFKYYDTPISEDSGLLGGGVVTQNGIKTVTLTAGRSKDIGNPYRQLTAAEIQQLQQSVNNEYANFVQFVSDQRKLKPDTIRNQIGAMIYDNQTAQTLGLIDGTANQQDAFVQLAKAAHLQDYQVMREVTPTSLVSSLLGAITHAPKPAVQAFDTCGLTHVQLAYYGDLTTLCQ